MPHGVYIGHMTVNFGRSLPILDVIVTVNNTCVIEYHMVDRIITFNIKICNQMPGTGCYLHKLSRMMGSVGTYYT
jgi:hypothetical protein